MWQTARQIARRHKEAIALGNDPKAERDNYRAMPTLSEFFHQTYVPFIKRHKKSWDKDVQRFTQYIEPRLGYVTAISGPEEIQQVLFDMLEGRIHGQQYAPSTCNRALAILKTMGRYALRQDVLEKNEADKIPLLKRIISGRAFLMLMRSGQFDTLLPNIPTKLPGD